MPAWTFGGKTVEDKRFVNTRGETDRNYSSAYTTFRIRNDVQLVIFPADKTVVDRPFFDHRNFSSLSNSK